eukprot:4551867-Alexandrium_andersonii.AAC.1
MSCEPLRSAPVHREPASACVDQHNAHFSQDGLFSQSVRRCQFVHSVNQLCSSATSRTRGLPAPYWPSSR